MASASAPHAILDVQDGAAKARIILHFARDLLTGVGNGRVVATTKSAPDLIQGRSGHFPRQVHRDLTGPGQVLGASFGHDLIGGNVMDVANDLHDIGDLHRPGGITLEKGGENLGGHFQ